MKIAYNHILNRIDSNPDIKEISRKLLQLGHEHEIQDNIIDIEITPNRGDCLSLNGILRDLSVFYDVIANKNIYQDEIDDMSINFENNAKSDCQNISFLKIEIDNDISSYSSDLKDYFSDLGINKNNFFTDISNYISYETGQPTHCYDLEKIGDTFSLDYIDNEVIFKTLMNKEIKLSGRNLVFLKNNDVINLAGVMGGENTSCSPKTRSVLVECAHFNPESIIGKSVKYDLNSDAAYKFERGVDPNAHENILRRFIQIASEHATIKNIKLYKKNYKEFKHTEIPLNIDVINKIIGIQINEVEYKDYLSKLGFIIKDNVIKVPSYRSDVKGQNDLAEEISRIIGFDNIPVKEIKLPNKEINKTEGLEKKLKHFLIDYGFYEVINNPFISDKSNNSIEVDNPLDKNKKFLRTNIKESLINNLIYNERRQNDSIKFFEFSDIYTIDKDIKQKRVVGIIASGRVSKHYENFHKHIDMKYLSELFSKILPEKNIKFEIISRDKLDTKLKNKILYLELDFDEIKNDLNDYNRISSDPMGYISYMPISEYPKVFRDLSFSINNYNSIKKLHDLIMNYKNRLLIDKFVFDFFNNSKLDIVKIGFRFSFQSNEKTLLDKDVNDIMEDIIKKSKKISGVEIPGI